MTIIPMRDLKDTVEIERLCAEAGGPVFVTKNGYGKLVVMKNNEVTAIPLSESAGKLKYVSPDDSIVANAKMLGISFGD